MAYISEYNAFQNIHPPFSFVGGSLVDKALISGSHKGTLPGNRVFAEVIKLKCKKGKIWTQRQIHTGKRQGGAAQNAKEKMEACSGIIYKPRHAWGCERQGRMN